MRLWDGVLATLVALSVALSAALWWQEPAFRDLPAATVPVRPRVAVREPASLTRPPLLLHFGDGRHGGISPGQALYNYIWPAVAAALPAIQFDRLAAADEPSAEEIALRRQDAAVELTLPGAVPIGDWLDTWGLARPAPPGGEAAVARVLISLREPATVVVWTHAGPRLLRTPSATMLRDRLQLLGKLRHQTTTPLQPLPEQLATVSVAAGLFVPSVAALPVFVAPEEPRLARDPARAADRFFLDLSVVRTVTEHDQAMLFTDGQSGLRVYPWGGVEYQRAPGQAAGETPALPEALDRVSQYVYDRDEWPRGAYLSGSVADLDGRDLQFSQRLGGWPVFAPEPALEVRFDHSAIVRYTRKAHAVAQVTGETAVVAPEEALAAAAEAIGWRTVTAVELGYLRPDQHPGGTWPAPGHYAPVWRIATTGGLSLTVDARTGLLMGGEAR